MMPSCVHGVGADAEPVRAGAGAGETRCWGDVGGRPSCQVLCRRCRGRDSTRLSVVQRRISTSAAIPIISLSSRVASARFLRVLSPPGSRSDPGQSGKSPVESRGAQKRGRNELQPGNGLEMSVIIADERQGVPEGASRDPEVVGGDSDARREGGSRAGVDAAQIQVKREDHDCQDALLQVGAAHPAQSRQLGSATSRVGRRAAVPLVPAASRSPPTSDQRRGPQRAAQGWQRERPSGKWRTTALSRRRRGVPLR